MDRYKCEDLLVHSSRLDLSFVKLSELIYIYVFNFFPMLRWSLDLFFMVLNFNLLLLFRFFLNEALIISSFFPLSVSIWEITDGLANPITSLLL